MKKLKYILNIYYIDDFSIEKIHNLEIIKSFIPKMKKCYGFYFVKVENFSQDGNDIQISIEYISKEVNGKVIPKKKNSVTLFCEIIQNYVYF